MMKEKKTLTRHSHSVSFNTTENLKKKRVKGEEEERKIVKESKEIERAKIEIIYINNLKKKKEKLTEEVRKFRKERKELKVVYDIWAENEHKINVLKQEIQKYMKIIENCKQTYIDLSFQCNKIKKELSQYNTGNNN